MSQEDLHYRIFELLVELSTNDDICDLAWGAITGDDALDAAIDGKPSVRPARAEREAVPAGAFLTSLAVEGFRGIGSKAMINFRPGPGLVIVAGRNGSGKSSLAEGFEYALTNTTSAGSSAPASWSGGATCTIPSRARSPSSSLRRMLANPQS
jgi:AAA domain